MKCHYSCLLDFLVAAAHASSAENCLCLHDAQTKHNGGAGSVDASTPSPSSSSTASAMSTSSVSSSTVSSPPAETRLWTNKAKNKHKSASVSLSTAITAADATLSGGGDGKLSTTMPANGESSGFAILMDCKSEGGAIQKKDNQ